MSTSENRDFHLARERHALSMAALAIEPAHRELHQQLADMHAEKAAAATATIIAFPDIMPETAPITG